MSNTFRTFASTLVQLLAVLLLLGSQNSLQANDGEPVAVRSWPAGVLTVETHWGLSIAISENKEAANQVVKDMSRQPDQTIMLSQSVDHLLTRKPNAGSPSWQPIAKNLDSDPNAIRVVSIPGVSDKGQALLIEVDGVRVLVQPIAAIDVEAMKANDKLKDVDLLILIGDQSWFRSVAQQALIHDAMEILNPNLVLLNAPANLEPATAHAISSSIGKGVELRAVDHNTLAISKSVPRTAAPAVITLTDGAWQMPVEMETLFAKMEKSCGQSQVIFSRLSTNQMNFKPDNGTHTPRWNAEHMMGRQLGFFSGIYHAIDPSLPVMDLNPKQMPPDYVFAHPDWTGAEEARQMQRVSEFCRRFAYLLEGVTVDQKAPGSRWPTLGALLKQMDRHYGEHTDNTIKKFELPDWPKE